MYLHPTLRYSLVRAPHASRLNAAGSTPQSYPGVWTKRHCEGFDPKIVSGLPEYFWTGSRRTCCWTSWCHCCGFRISGSGGGSLERCRTECSAFGAATRSCSTACQGLSFETRWSWISSVWCSSWSNRPRQPKFGQVHLGLSTSRVWPLWGDSEHFRFASGCSDFDFWWWPTSWCQKYEQQLPNPATSLKGAAIAWCHQCRCWCPQYWACSYGPYHSFYHWHETCLCWRRQQSFCFLWGWQLCDIGFVCCFDFFSGWELWSGTLG